MKKLLVIVLMMFSLSACAHGYNRGYGYNHPNRGWGVPIGAVVVGTVLGGAIYHYTQRPPEYVVQQPVYVQQPPQYVDPTKPVPVCSVVPVVNEYGQIVSYRQVCQ